MASPEGNAKVLYKILPEVARYLNADIILMYMFKQSCLEEEDYKTLMEARDSGKKYRFCNELAVLVNKKRCFGAFMKALEESLSEEKAHEDILRLIREEQIRVTSEDPTPKPPPPPNPSDDDNGVTDKDGPFIDRSGRDGPKQKHTGAAIETEIEQVNDSSNAPLVPVDGNQDQTAAHTVEDPTQVAAEEEEEKKGTNVGTFCLGNLCTGLCIIVIVLAGSGIALMYYAAEGWRGKVNCTIKQSGQEGSDPDPERSAIFAFNFISGFICLVVPIIFLLLLIHVILARFCGKLFDKPFLTKVLIGLLVGYIAVCILISLAQLGLSIYVALLIFPSYKIFSKQEVVTDSISIFQCDDVVYLSAFVSLIITYILVFAILAVVVGLFIANRVNAYFHIVVDDLFVACIDAFKAGQFIPRNNRDDNARRDSTNQRGRPSVSEATQLVPEDTPL